MGDTNEFLAITESEVIEVTNIDIVNSEMLRIQYNFAEDFISPSPVTNVFVAAFTTKHARLKLYSYLEKLQEQVLYFDTDCFFFQVFTWNVLFSCGILSWWSDIRIRS